MVLEPIYHLAVPDDWEQARVAGRYEWSTRGRTLADEGFIHASFRHQLDGVANGFYADLDELILLTIDPARLDVELKLEPVPPNGDEFPHLYGPLAVDAVTATETVTRSGGRWELR